MAAPGPAVQTQAQRADLRFLLSHPAHAIALGLGCGLARRGPGTIGTLGAWLIFAAAPPSISTLQWGVILLVAAGLGVWACTRTARDLGHADPGCIVWDEMLAFWLVLWLVMPAGFLAQLAAFGLFRLFDIAKPGPVAWADRLFKRREGEPIGWRQGWGILFDDLVAALCALVIIALWVSAS